MARKLRVEYSGAIYHVMLRGNNRRTIFCDDNDRTRFVIRIEEIAEEFGVRIFAFCIMPNHVHLLLETPYANLGRFMHKLETAYTVYFNLRHKEVGHLFQGRYKAKLVEGDEYLLKLSRYVHLNPVWTHEMENLTITQRIEVLRSYRWSSYPCYLGLIKRAFIDTAPLLALMGKRCKRTQRLNFRSYVENAIVEPDDTIKNAIKHSQLAIGGEEFQSRILGLYEQLLHDRAKPEDISLRRKSERLQPEEIIEICCRHLQVAPSVIRKRQRNEITRAVVAWELGHHAGKTQREIAQMFGVRTGKAVSMQQEKVRANIKTDNKLARLIDAIDSEIRNIQVVAVKY